jgi:hypothetical protein
MAIGGWIRSPVRVPPLRVAVVLGAIVAGTLAVGLLGPGDARAASPQPSNDLGGDTRSAGEGPGLVGAPGLAIGGVILLGLVAAGLTTAYIRFTGGSRPATAPVVRRGATAGSDGGGPTDVGPTAVASSADPAGEASESG